MFQLRGLEVECLPESCRLLVQVTPHHLPPYGQVSAKSVPEDLDGGPLLEGYIVFQLAPPPAWEGRACFPFSHKTHLRVMNNLADCLLIDRSKITLVQHFQNVIPERCQGASSGVPCKCCRLSLDWGEESGMFRGIETASGFRFREI